MGLLGGEGILAAHFIKGQQGIIRIERLDFTNNELRDERRRLMKLARLCANHRGADGENAARAQLRAVEKEIAAREAGA